MPSPHPRRFSNQQLRADFETLRDGYISSYTCGLPATSRRTLDSVCSAIDDNLAGVSVRRSEPNLPPHLRKALMDLKGNGDIVVSKADKGDAVVIMDVGHYTSLAWNHLSDADTYSLLTEEPVPTIVSGFNSYLKRCREDRVIDAWMHDRLKLTQDTSIQTMYFLPKVHKTPVKLRPIVSCSGGPTERASRYLDALLQPHAKRVDSYVGNSTEVVNRLRDLTFPNNVALASLDVESLYTNISHGLAIQTFARSFQSHPKYVFLLDLLKFVLSNNVFTFDGRYFRQTCGLAMGTSLARALATIVVADLEEAYLRRAHFKPLSWIRYIDDVFAVWQHSEENFSNFVQGLNQPDDRIQFTSELSAISTTFLDLRIYRPPDFSIRGKLSTSISYKRTNTFSHVMGSSHIMPHTFRGIAMAETIRALRNSDSEIKFQRVQRQLIHRFKRRAYPSAALKAIKDFDFSQRIYYLEMSNPHHIERPLPFNTLYYRFSSSINALFRRVWKNMQGDRFLWVTVPNPPFLTCRNHRTVGKILSHKRRDFGTMLPQPTLCPENGTEFCPQKFNRPRRKQDLIKNRPSTTLSHTDHTCGNTRCQVCPHLRRPNFVASTANLKTFPVDTSLKCTTSGVIYLLTCRRCDKQYIGQTAQSMRQRLARHKLNFKSAPCPSTPTSAFTITSTPLMSRLHS